MSTDCPALSAPVNGYITSNSTSPNTSVAFICDQCYDLIGPEILSCLSNYSWDGSVPECYGLVPTYTSAMGVVVNVCVVQ